MYPSVSLGTSQWDESCVCDKRGVVQMHGARTPSTSLHHYVPRDVWQTGLESRNLFT